VEFDLIFAGIIVLSLLKPGELPLTHRMTALNATARE
jgi:hypothetical protein